MSSSDPPTKPTPSTTTDAASTVAGAQKVESPKIEPSIAQSQSTPAQNVVVTESPPTTTGADNIESTISDSPTNTASSAVPVVRISLLLTTGTRHPMVVTRNYLKKRNMLPEDNDPFSLTVYQLKQMIWNDWQNEWSERPSSPTYIRLIYFGSMLSDTTPLRDTRLNHTEPNVVHMTVKPQELFEEEDKITKDTKNRDTNTRSGGLNCCVIL